MWKSKLIVILIVLLTFSFSVNAENVNNKEVLTSEKQFGLGLIQQSPENDPFAKRVWEVKPISKARKLMETTSCTNYEYLPPVKSQGYQNSCVAWAVGYYYKTYYENKEDNRTSVEDLANTTNMCSPAFIYNLIHLKGDKGAYYSDAFNILNDFGCCSYEEMPYSSYNYTTWPTEENFRKAIVNRSTTSSVLKYYYLLLSSDNALNQVKQRLLNGDLVMIGINIFANFENISNYNNNYAVANMTGNNKGGHAQVIVGFDDNHITDDGVGAFRVINSWGTSWGDSGYYWMSYKAVKSTSPLSQNYVYWCDDLIDYAPTHVAIFRMSHDYYRETNTWIDFGGNAKKEFFDLYAKGYEHEYQAFPLSKIVVDISDYANYLKIGDIVDLHMEDDSAVTNSSTGIIYSFSIEFSNVVELSDDTPVSVLEDEDEYSRITLSTAPSEIYTYNLPHIDWSEQWSSYLVVTSGSEQEGSIQVILYDNEGKELSSTDYSVEQFKTIKIALDKGECGKVLVSGDNIFLQENFVNNVEGGIAAFQLSTESNTEITYLLPAYNGENLSWMGIALMNPGDENTKASLSAIDSSGVELETVEVDINAHCRSVDLLTHYFSATNFKEIAKIKVKSTKSVTGITISGNGNKQLLFTAATKSTYETGELCISHIATEWENWQNTLVFDNVGDVSISAQLVLYDLNGTEHLFDISVEGWKTVCVDLNEYADINPQCGKVVVTSDKLAVRQSFLSIKEKGTAEFVLSSTLNKELIYLIPAGISDVLTWHGLSLYNLSDESVSSTLIAYSNGVEVARCTKEITKHSRIVDVLENFFGETDLIDSIIVSASQPLTGINISGSNWDRLLFATVFSLVK